MSLEANCPFGALKVAEDLRFRRLELPTIGHLEREFRMAFGHHHPIGGEVCKRSLLQCRVKAQGVMVGDEQVPWRAHARSPKRPFRCIQTRGYTVDC